MATQWFSNMVVDEPSFFHQWQSDALLEQYTEQQIAVAFGGHGGLDLDLDLDLDHGVATPPPLQRVPAPAADHRPRKAARGNASWDSCVTEQGSPDDYSSPTILSFAGHHAKAPKQELLDAAAAALPSFQQARPAPKRSYDDMMAEAARSPAAAARPASQNQDHILAERKRREKLSQRFIALSKIVPGLKKMDKASVLGDAIKYVKQLQDQVKGLEDDARRRPVEAAVLVKKSQLSADDDEGSSCDDNSVGAEASATLLPEIEARLSGRTVLVRVHCDNRKGVLIAALSEVERLGLSVMNTNVLPFTASSLDITIMAMAGDDFCLSAKDIVKKLNQAFKSPF
ncbi:symbiotic ammonium transporter [Zea mays]|uniref:Symbiotic ammonium transporter n=1 Tax=Zea mays TaxID=4577 RepID=A0A1D6GIH0_MAIZE|nr:symbiotic ammonium transporter [Zea mays]AQK63231.1 Symbiotic ammonium transporter [Zea mays]|eukprot:NP_001340100.1 symbiotic ammonium transporter [Zea mays]